MNSLKFLFKSFTVLLLVIAFSVCIYADIGNVNDDFYVDERDYIVLSRYLAGFEVALNIECMDVYRDGRIDSKDAVYFLQYLAGIRDNFYDGASHVVANDYEEIIFGGIGRSANTFVLPIITLYSDEAIALTEKIDNDYRPILHEILGKSDYVYNVGYTNTLTNGIIGITVFNTKNADEVDSITEYHSYYFDTVHSRELNYFEYLEALGVNYSDIAKAVNSKLGDSEKAYSTSYLDFEIRKAIVGEDYAEAIVTDENGRERRIIVAGDFVGRSSVEYDIALLIENLYKKDGMNFAAELLNKPIEALLVDANNDSTPELLTRYREYGYEYICLWSLNGDRFTEIEMDSSTASNDSTSYVTLDESGYLSIHKIIKIESSPEQTIYKFFLDKLTDITPILTPTLDKCFMIEKIGDSKEYYIQNDDKSYSKISKEEYEEYRDEQLEFIEKYSISSERNGFSGVWLKQCSKRYDHAEMIKNDSSLVSNEIEMKYDSPSKINDSSCNSIVFPKINIETVAAKRFNSRLLKKYSNYIEKIENVIIEYASYDIDYTFSICDNTIGILIREACIAPGSYSYTDISGYYFDIEADRELNFFEYLERLGVGYSGLVYTINEQLSKDPNNNHAVFSTDYADYDIQAALFTNESAIVVIPETEFKEKLVTVNKCFINSSDQKYDVADALERFYYKNKVQLASERDRVSLSGYYIADLDLSGTPELVVKYFETSSYCDFVRVYTFDSGIIRSGSGYGESYGFALTEDVGIIALDSGEIIICNVSYSDHSYCVNQILELQSWTEFGCEKNRFKNIYVRTEYDDEEAEYFKAVDASYQESVSISKEEYDDYVEQIYEMLNKCISPSGRELWNKQKKILAKS